MERTHDGTPQEPQLSRESTDYDTIAVIERDRIRDIVDQTDPLHERESLCRADSGNLAGRTLQAYDVAVANLGEVFGAVGCGIGGADVLFELRRGDC